MIIKNRKLYKSNSDFAYHTLKDNIIELIIKPGEQLHEKNLSELLNVSRTPIREAFLLLEADSLISIKPKLGTFVEKIDINDIKELTYIRKTIEKDIIKQIINLNISQKTLSELEDLIKLQETLLNLGMEDELNTFLQLDNKFHELLYSTVDRKQTWNILNSMSSSINRLRKLDSLTGFSNKIRVSEHNELIDIIKYKKIKSIDSYVEKHISLNDNHIKKLKSIFPDFFY